MKSKMNDGLVKVPIWKWRFNILPILLFATSCFLSINAVMHLIDRDNAAEGIKRDTALNLSMWTIVAILSLVWTVKSIESYRSRGGIWLTKARAKRLAKELARIDNGDA